MSKQTVLDDLVQQAKDSPRMVAALGEARKKVLAVIRDLDAEAVKLQHDPDDLGSQVTRSLLLHGTMDNVVSQAFNLHADKDSDETPTDQPLSGALNEIGDDRVHAEVHRILEQTMEAMMLHGPQVVQGMGLAIKTIDPYHLVEGKLLRKSDGKPIHCDQCPTGETP